MRAILQTFEILYEVGAAMAYSAEWPNWYEGNEFRALRDEQRIEAGVRRIVVHTNFVVEAIPPVASEQQPTSTETKST